MIINNKKHSYDKEFQENYTNLMKQGVKIV